MPSNCWSAAWAGPGSRTDRIPTDRRAPVRSKGGAIEWVYWDSGTARCSPDCLASRTAAPVRMARCSCPAAFRPVPSRRPAVGDICPRRLGYDRARVVLEKYAGLDLHQLRHNAATPRRGRGPAAAHHGQDPAQEPRTAMRYIKPGAEAIAKATEVLAPRRRTH